MSKWTEHFKELDNTGVPPSAHNILDSIYHGDALTGAIARGDVLTGQGVTPKIARLAKGAAFAVLTGDGTDTAWSSYLLSGTAGGKTILAVTNTKTLTLTVIDNYNLTIPGTGTAALGAGTLTVATANDVTGANHTHAITSSSNPGAAAAILATNASGNIQVVSITATAQVYTSGYFLTGYSANPDVLFARDANWSYLFSNWYYSGGAKYSQTGGSAAIFLGISAGAGAGDISFNSAASGAAGAAVTLVETMRLKRSGVLKIAGTAVRATTEGTNHIDIFNGTAPVGTLANGISLYSALGELNVLDAAGNNTLLSPHGFPLFNPSKDAIFPWSYLSENRYIGKRVNADVCGALMELEKISGKKFIYTEDVPTLDWDADELKTKERIEAERLQKAMAKEIEVMLIDALETVEVTEKKPTGKKLKTGKFVLNSDGSITEAERDETAEVGTGKFKKQPKSGIRFDENSGKFYRTKTRDEAIKDIEPYVPKQMPAWMAERVPTKTKGK